LKVTVTPGFAASKFLPISVKASVSDAAAKTFKVRGSGAVVGGMSIGTDVGGTIVGGGNVGTGVGVAAGAHPAERSTSNKVKYNKRFIIISLECGIVF
jgi:hypothetical protein